MSYNILRQKIFTTENDAMNWIDQMDKIYDSPPRSKWITRKIMQERHYPAPSLHQSFGAGGVAMPTYEFRVIYEVED